MTGRHTGHSEDPTRSVRTFTLPREIPLLMGFTILALLIRSRV